MERIVAILVAATVATGGMMTGGISVAYADSDEGMHECSDRDGDRKGRRNKYGRHHGMGMSMDFDSLDADGDGMLTQADLDSIMNSRFAEIDGDGDGQVTREEMLGYMDTKSEDRRARYADRRIDNLDTNEDGSISLEEFSAVKGQRKGIERLDKDSDGSVSKEEFDEAVSKKGRKGKNRGKSCQKDK